jgi:hypothetical protein
VLLSSNLLPWNATRFADHPKMTDERLALIVRSAFRGMMEAVLESGEAGESHAPPASSFSQEAGRPAQAVVPEEIPFPSVTKAEESLFGETPPPTLNEMAFSGDFPPADLNLDAALAARARARAYAEQNLQPQTQGGPGEKDVAEWLRLPQQ